MARQSFLTGAESAATAPSPVPRAKQSALRADTHGAMRLTTLLYAVVVMTVELAWIGGLVYGVLWLVQR